MICADPVIPIADIISRQTRELDHLREYLSGLRWWQYRQRWAIGGAITILVIEIAAHEQLAGSCQPIIRDQPIRHGPGREDRVRTPYRGDNSASARTRP